MFSSWRAWADAAITSEVTGAGREPDGRWPAGGDPRTDYAYHLTRRPRGLPLWSSLAVHGTDAYRDAIARGAGIARWTADRVRATDGLELLREPELTVVLVRRTGWRAGPQVTEKPPSTKTVWPVT
ncbi:hypothetical protein ACFVT2_11260 [Streptomyces sp. NPDC058000]|uniref:hypothetical protein n=1 Tax=Streptomyces sp. NPDC058000 TaxID=3346299 RepID=UPI0036E5264C